MTDRDRLIELLKPHVSGTACLCESGSCELTSCRDCKARRLADHLLANGVIVPPCKVGDTLYYPWIYGGTSGIAMLEASSIRITKKGKCLVYFEDPEIDMPMPTCFTEDDFEQSVFTNKGVAKRVLRKCMKNDTSA